MKPCGDDRSGRMCQRHILRGRKCEDGLGDLLDFHLSRSSGEDIDMG